MCSGATPVALTVMNYLSWCSVTVGSGMPSSAASQTVCVADGSVNLEARRPSVASSSGRTRGTTPPATTVAATLER